MYFLIVFMFLRFSTIRIYSCCSVFNVLVSAWYKKGAYIIFVCWSIVKAIKSIVSPFLCDELAYRIRLVVFGYDIGFNVVQSFNKVFRFFLNIYENYKTYYGIIVTATSKSNQQ